MVAYYNTQQKKKIKNSQVHSIEEKKGRTQSVASPDYNPRIQQTAVAGDYTLTDSEGKTGCHQGGECLLQEHARE